MAPAAIHPSTSRNKASRRINLTSGPNTDRFAFGWGMLGGAPNRRAGGLIKPAMPAGGENDGGKPRLAKLPSEPRLSTPSLPRHMFSWLSVAMAKYCKAATACARALRSTKSVLDAASMRAVRMSVSSYMDTCKAGSAAKLAKAWQAYSFARQSSGTSTMMRAPFSKAARAPSASDHNACFKSALAANIARPLSATSRTPRNAEP
mmetsp:Transcript_47649/g.137123  ORF Transcript_47649/g.137123 Transcript_47649/m.137123 type:complete len:205 (+) Transcript_47649:163-777(+)